jgi:hypothetical protein
MVTKCDACCALRNLNLMPSECTSPPPTTRESSLRIYLKSLCLSIWRRERKLLGHWPASLQEPSHICEKCLIAWSCLCVFLSLSNRLFAWGKKGLPPDGFPWNLILEDLLKICRENSSFIMIWQKYRALYICGNISLNSHPCSGKSSTENQNGDFMFNNFFPKIVPFFFEIMWINLVQPDRSRMTK